MTYYTLSEKVCPDCGLNKSAAAFSRNAARPDGLRYYCKNCYSKRAARTYRDRQARKGRTVRERVVAPEGHKYCPGCREVSPLSNWHRNVTARDGYASYCKNCRKLQGAENHLRRTFGISIDERDAFEDDPQRLIAAARYLMLHGAPKAGMAAIIDIGYWTGPSPLEANLRLHPAS